MEYSYQMLAERSLRDMSDGVLLMDLKGVITLSNRKAMEVLELDTDIVGSRFATLLEQFGPENNDFFQLIIDSIYEKTREHEAYVDYTVGSGKVLRLRVCSSFLMSEDGTDKMGVVIIFSDVTAMSSLQNQIRHASVTMIVLTFALCLYLFIFSFMSSYGVNVARGFHTLIAQCTTIFIVSYLAVFMKLTRKTLGFYVTNVKETLSTAIVISVLGILLLVGAKVVLLHTTSKLSAAAAPFWNWSRLDWTSVIYPFTVLLQEFIMRSVIQESLRQIFVGKRAGLMAIAVSSLTFGVFHIANGFMYMILSAVMLGILGGIYEKQRNIIGVSIIHYFVGLAAFFLGFVG